MRTGVNLVRRRQLRDESRTHLDGFTAIDEALAKEVPLKGKSVFVRADLNVPVKNGVIRNEDLLLNGEGFTISDQEMLMALAPAASIASGSPSEYRNSRSPAARRTVRSV